MGERGWRFWNGWISQELVEDCIGPAIDWEAEFRKILARWGVPTGDPEPPGIIYTDGHE